MGYMGRLEGNVAIITGGASGIGEASVRLFVSEGARVVIADIQDEKGMRLATKLGNAIYQHTDVTIEDDVRKLVEKAVSSFGRLDVLFNNAGIAGGGSMVTDDRAEWERTFGVDWGGVYLGTRTFLPLLLASDEGHVLNTSSINGLWASVGPATPHTAYSAAKFAVRGFTEALITDFRVNAPHLHASVVMPGCSPGMREAR